MVVKLELLGLMARVLVALRFRHLSLGGFVCDQELAPTVRI
jgi:hypothetical protein